MLGKTGRGQRGPQKKNETAHTPKAKAEEMELGKKKKEEEDTSGDSRIGAESESRQGKNLAAINCVG